MAFNNNAPMVIVWGCKSCNEAHSNSYEQYESEWLVEQIIEFVDNDYKFSIYNGGNDVTLEVMLTIFD